MILNQRQKWHNCIRYVIVELDPFTNNLRGTAQLDIYNETQWHGSKCEIHSLWVREYFRQRGIATRILRECERVAKLENCEDITAEISTLDSEQFVSDFLGCQHYNLLAKLEHNRKIFRKYL